VSGITDDVDAAASVLRSGGVVAFPTETVYGLGARVGDAAAVQRVFTIKGRPADHPLIVHVAATHDVGRWAATVSVAAAKLTDALWPGPLTVLVHRSARVPDVVTGGRDTVGLWVPAHPLALALIAAIGDGVAAPSANRFGRVSPTTAAHVMADLGTEVDLVLDGGPCTVGIESTIVDCTVDPPLVLRPGGVPVEQLTEVLGYPVEVVTSGPARAPGMLAAHYAPTCRVELVPDRAAAERRRVELSAAGHAVDVHDPGPDLAHYARGLFAALRDADTRCLDTMVVVAAPEAALGRAINDRLRRAARREAP
jgi:L-threonylcarbamoyladenylate synthase